MHQSAMDGARDFFRRYEKEFPEATVVEIGSQNVNGSIREVTPKNYKYIGLDFQAAKGVDIVLEDPYKFPLEDKSTDFVVTSSCFEHSEMFWLTFLEGIRLLKDNGLMYVNAPSRGGYHAYPVDCWRFYPDAANALNTWAKRNGYNTSVEYTMTLEGCWGDFIAVYRKNP